MCEHKNLFYIETETTDYIRSAQLVDGVLVADLDETPDAEGNGGILDRFFRCYDCDETWACQGAYPDGSEVRQSIEEATS